MRVQTSKPVHVEREFSRGKGIILRLENPLNLGPNAPIKSHFEKGGLKKALKKITKLF